MPRFYFDLREGTQFTADEEGLDYPDLDAAEREAMLVAAEIAKDQLPRGRVREIAVDLRDQHGLRLLTATVSLRIEPAHSRRTARPRLNPATRPGSR
ncbi:hypothetical protein OPKNFCMD_4966 [Methylobacterium crusticola]|uniref:DUF6894 domain-containing protein n=1 Tax=Methylobacterium crusticola TaxID=1697972 RepID=A0ABQ4R5Y7_9HYPH|nr:hypothetical protein [Methylobacterium crusticola]GJD52204.1 hypothetical protein OPKNFCMD_4966 [Methylobacterium crusticola]